MSGPELWRVLRDLEHESLDPADATLLRPAFAALHGGEAIALPEDLIVRVHELNNSREGRNS
jgi:hypothetical protein